MKNYFIQIFILCALFAALSGHGQSIVHEAQYKYGDVALGKFLNKKFAQESRKYTWPSCIVSVVFAKFCIDSVGNVKDLTLSELNSTPQILRTMLTSTILATNGSWLPSQINGKTVESRPFILPLIYDLEAGCTVYGADGKPVYRTAPNNMATALRYILNFENNVGGNNNQLNCILLQPLQIFSAN